MIRTPVEYRPDDVYKVVKLSNAISLGYIATINSFDGITRFQITKSGIAQWAKEKAFA